MKIMAFSRFIAQQRSLSEDCKPFQTRYKTLENLEMKLPLLGAVSALTIAMGASAMATESNNKETVSGASDSTVMSQTQNAKVQQKQHKQNQADENKRGRPSTESKPASN